MQELQGNEKINSWLNVRCVTNDQVILQHQTDASVVLLDKAAAQALKPPSFYQVILHNDDYTPMDFVVVVLQRFFAMDHDKATRTMLEIHQRGRAVCGVYTRDIAETKVAQVTQYAREGHYPLLCTMEKLAE